MKKFKGMLLACDMDGTLLDDSKQIPAENLRALQYFTKQGGRLSLATGRSPHAIGTYIDSVAGQCAIQCDEWFIDLR